MSPPGAPPSFLSQLSVELSHAVLSGYRLWICRNLNKLLEGDQEFWNDFSESRERLLLTGGPLAARIFGWEAGFTADRVPCESLSRQGLCEIGGISPASLRLYEGAGIIERLSVPIPTHQVKRLQWVLFFLKEMRIPVHGLASVLSFEAVRTLLGNLALSRRVRSPIHLSPPADRAAMPSEGKEITPAGNREFYHDLGNRLQIIGGRANLLKRKLTGNPVAEKNLSIMLSQLELAEAALKAQRESGAVR